MKKILFLIAFLAFGFIQAQEHYYQVEVNGFIENAGSCGSLKGLRGFKLIYTDGSEEELNDRRYENESFSFETKITNGKKIERVEVLSKRQTGNVFGCNNNDDTLEVEIVNGNMCYLKRNNSAFGITAGWYEIKITPILVHRDVGANAVIREDVAIKLGIVNNTVDLKYFNWKFSLDRGATWNYLPARFQNDDFIAIAGSDFLNDTDYGGEVYIHIDTECHGSVSNSLIFDARRSAPYIIGNDNPVEPTCFGEDNGSITLRFSRALLPNESLAFRVLDKANGDTPLTLDPFFDDVRSFRPDNTFTINGLPKSEAGFRVEFLNPDLYTGDDRHKLDFNIGSPDVVSFTDPSFTDVSCRGGSDGTISFSASGGNPASGYQYQLYRNDEFFTRPPLDDWTSFNAGVSHTRSGLPFGNYTVRVRDFMGCESLILTDINNDGIFEIAGELTKTITIEQPAATLQVDFLTVDADRDKDSNDARGAGLTDGRIVAVIRGGTGPYNLVWKNGATVLNTITIEEFGSNATNDYSVRATLNAIGAGTYSLWVTDANHNATAVAVNKETCEIVDAEFSISEPPPLAVSITESQSISCNNTNVYNDPYSDGELTATASGGIPLDNFVNGGLRYYYTWKKFTNGSWATLTAQTRDVATDLDEGTYAVNIEDANGVSLTNDIVFILGQPTPIQIDFEKQDVYCHQGMDGWAKALVTGGTPPYTILWDTRETTEQISGLEADIYTVTVRDANGCRGVESIVITEPDDFISIDYTAYTRPSSFGASDGVIVAQIQGGTADAAGTYNYTWTNENDDPLNSRTTSGVLLGAPSRFQITLENISSGTYYLTIEDANYTNATTKDNCTVVQNEFVLYDPIEAVINVVIPISCNDENDFFNPFSDGVLQASVRGGLPFSSGQPYLYHWKKRNVSGIYEDLTAQTTETATGLSSGSYALNVEDSLGNVIGIYNSDVLLEATDEELLFEAPNLVELQLTSTPVSCYGYDDGSAMVSVIGGTGNYTFLWSHGGTTPNVENLIAGVYFVYVKDEKGCEVTGQVTVLSPEDLTLNTDDQKAPTCFDGNDGHITVAVGGGTAPYSYSWSSGETIAAISDLTAATYSLTVTDANGCTATNDITLENPLRDLITLGEDRILCGGQSVTFDASYGDDQTLYSWTSDNGFSSNEPTVTISEAGMYEVSITTSLGCSGGDSITITTSDIEIDAHFVVSTQSFSGEELALINISSPLGDNVEWFFPPEAEIIGESKETAILLFDAPGSYDVILRSYQGDCYLDFMKSVIVEEAENIPDIGDAENPFIKEFLVYPNPSNGNFKVDISLSGESEISLKLFSTASQALLNQRKEAASATFSLDYGVALASGSYILLLETAKGNEIRKVLIE